MQFDRVLQNRFSCRSFDPLRPVPEGLIDECLRAARLAPSACNAQPWRFVVVTDEQKRRSICDEALGGLVPNRWAADAPVLVILAAVRKLGTALLGEGIKDIPYHLMDCGSSGEHLVLKATELGLGSCWLGWFRDKPLRRLIRAPKSWKLLAIIALGWPKEGWEPLDRSRMDLGKIAFRDDARTPWNGVDTN
ncbi:nitroreductase family protein [bacterium]|nr:nitroreductase family protein [bacterium]